MACQHFVIVSYLRSGTHLLRTALESHPAIVCQTEVFNSDNPNLPYPLSTPTEKVLSEWVFKDFPESIQQAGFVLQAYHPYKLKAFPGIRDNPAWADIWQILADMKGLKVVHLRRENLLCRHLSHVMARETGQWHQWDKERVKAVTHLDDSALSQANAEVLRDETATLDPERLETDFGEVSFWHRQADKLLGHHPVLQLSYEQLCSDFDDVCDSVLAFLGVAPHKLEAAVKKIEQRSLSESISNYSELKVYFSETEWAKFFSD